MPIQDSGSFAIQAAAALREQAVRLEKIGLPDLLGPWILSFDDFKVGFDAIKGQGCSTLITL